MAHQAQTIFFKMFFEGLPAHSTGKILDIGSMDINGGPHQLLTPSEYVGVDLTEGPNVSIACSGHLVGLQSEYFDMTMSSQCFEHNPVWRETFTNMIRMTKPGGIVIWTAAGFGSAEHGTSRSDGGFAAPAAIEVSQEYYSNVTTEQVEVCCNLNYHFEEYSLSNNWKERNIYFVGLKRGASEETSRIFKSLLKNLPKNPKINQLSYLFRFNEKFVISHQSGWISSFFLRLLRPILKHVSTSIKDPIRRILRFHQ